MEGRTAAGDIVVVLPIVRKHRDKTHQVDRGLEYKQFLTPAEVVEAAARIASLHIDAEGFAVAIRTASVRVPRHAGFVPADEDGVMIRFILVEQMLPREGGDYVWFNASLLDEVGKDPAHIAVGRRQGERLALLNHGIPRAIAPAMLSAQQH